jgi:phosphoribosylanthranilate isomerase
MNGTAALWIKVCGLRTTAAIEAAVAAGADAVGFVFYEPSPRYLAVADALHLQPAVPAGIERVAVFLHPSQSLVDEVIDSVRPDWVQIDDADLAQVRLPAAQRVLPVWRTGALDAASSASSLPPRFLLESASSGAGEIANWDQAAQLARRSQVVLAGGLRAGNVAEAIARVRPFGVDVSSGVESSRGVKSPALIQEFIEAARAAHVRVAH